MKKLKEPNAARIMLLAIVTERTAKARAEEAAPKEKPPALSVFEKQLRAAWEKAKPGCQRYEVQQLVEVLASGIMTLANNGKATSVKLFSAQKAFASGAKCKAGVLLIPIANTNDHNYGKTGALVSSSDSGGCCSAWKVSGETGNRLQFIDTRIATQAEVDAFVAGLSEAAARTILKSLL